MFILLILLRIVRALFGLFAIIMILGIFQDLSQLSQLPTISDHILGLAITFVLTKLIVLAICVAVFILGRKLINALHLKLNGTPHPKLSISIWKL